LEWKKLNGNLMHRKPRPAGEGVFSDGAGFDMVVQGLIMAAIVIASFFIGEYMETGIWRIAESRDGITMAFLTANFIEMFHAISMRSQKHSIFTMKSFNYWLLGAFLLTTMLTVVVIYVPFFASLFGFTQISFKELCTAFGLAFAIVPIIEVLKLFKKKE